MASSENEKFYKILRIVSGSRYRSLCLLTPDSVVSTLGIEQEKAKNLCGVFNEYLKDLDVGLYRVLKNGNSRNSEVVKLTASAFQTAYSILKVVTDDCKSVVVCNEGSFLRYMNIFHGGVQGVKVIQSDTPWDDNFYDMVFGAEKNNEFLEIAPQLYENIKSISGTYASIGLLEYFLNQNKAYERTAITSLVEGVYEDLSNRYLNMSSMALSSGVISLLERKSSELGFQTYPPVTRIYSPCVQHNRYGRIFNVLQTSDVESNSKLCRSLVESVKSGNFITGSISQNFSRKARKWSESGLLDILKYNYVTNFEDMVLSYDGIEVPTYQGIGDFLNLEKMPSIQDGVDETSFLSTFVILCIYAMGYDLNAYIENGIAVHGVPVTRVQ